MRRCIVVAAVVGATEPPTTPPNFPVTEPATLSKTKPELGVGNVSCVVASIMYSPAVETATWPNVGDCVRMEPCDTVVGEYVGPNSEANPVPGDADTVTGDDVGV